MDVALGLAEATIGQTSPNPSVGAVVVKDGRIIGMGSHLKPGCPHAEVYALQQAGEAAQGAELYVTLEPCSHYGKTPPCADLIIDNKLKKVYVASTDPNPKVAGTGIQKLKDAGIEVEIGLREARAKTINRTFFHSIRTNQPYVTLKAAMTLDGKTATATGDSRWITSEPARQDVHYQRSIHDAILVGIGTILKDDPQLTTRLPQGGNNPIRIVLDTYLRTPDQANVLTDEAPTWIVCGALADAEQFREKHRDINVIQMETKKIDIHSLLTLLGKKGIQSLYVEGGNSVHGSFVESGLFNACHWYIAPKLLGGLEAFSPVGGKGPILMRDSISLAIDSIEQIGSDIKIIALPKKEEG
ncbi:bifunctional diaminohydroxyphosphoribosylaminopyrimidine deaminase/5-amino-6-(5-phosphoribosylamino)uracil reductase RibD [Terrihalobacillus insolitus]